MNVWHQACFILGDFEVGMRNFFCLLGDDVGLSTLPAASILQLNYPLSSSSRRSISLQNDSAATMSACVAPASFATSRCQIIRPMNSKGIVNNINLQQLSSSAQKGFVHRPELSSSNHLNLSTLTGSSFAGGSAVPASILNNLVPVLKLPSSTTNRNDNKQKWVVDLVLYSCL